MLPPIRSGRVLEVTYEKHSRSILRRVDLMYGRAVLSQLADVTDSAFFGRMRTYFSFDTDFFLFFFLSFLFERSIARAR